MLPLCCIYAALARRILSMKQMTMFGVMVCLGALIVAGCESSTGSNNGDGGTGNEAGAGGSVAQSSSSGQGGAGNASSSSGGSGPGSSGSTSSSSSSGGADPYEAQRQACVDKINSLRATKGLPAYERWKEAEPCVDQQATWDEEHGQAHGAWGSQMYPSCNGSGQNECLGQGPNGIEGCLDSMWNEKDQMGCSGCDACADAYNPNCPNCTFSGGPGGTTCGHYVNMSAKYFRKVACGFSSLGGWDAINFSQ
jgi:hypothetical protein